MGCLGRHIALTPEQMKHLQGLNNGEVELDEDVDVDELIAETIEGIEQGLPSKYYHDTDKAWDGIHRALTLDDTPGGILSPESGERPLKLCIFGGESLCEDSEDYSAHLVEPDDVALVASALAEVDEAWMRKRYFTLDPRACGYDIDEEDWDYTWSNFRGLPDFFARAAAEGRAVVFTVYH